MDHRKSRAITRFVEHESLTDSLPVPRAVGTVAPTSAAAGQLPSLVASGGRAAQFAWEEFIYAQIRNQHTRAAYERAIRQFLSHCEGLGMELPTITPRVVGNYLDAMPCAPATKKLHLSGLRHFFDTLVSRHVVILNPAASVRGERFVEGG